MCACACVKLYAPEFSRVIDGVKHRAKEIHARK